MISASFAGCFGEEETEPAIVIETVWDFERPDLTWYHMPDAVAVSYTHLTLPTKA